MSPVEWYYARENNQMGPVSSVELKRLADVGELLPEDLVWREGMTEWSVARNVRGLFESENKGGESAVEGQHAPNVSDSASAITASAITASAAVASVDAASPAAPTAPDDRAAPTRHLFDVLLDAPRPHFNAHFVETTAKIFRACGSYGLFVAMAASAVLAILLAMKADALGHILSGVVLLLVLAVLQYVAGKFCDALDQLNRTTGVSLSSPVFPDCFALLSKLVGVVVLLGLIATAVETLQYSLILFGVAVFLVCAYLAVIAVNPATLNISIGAEARAGEEAIGVLTFLLKALLRLVPVAFGAGVLYGTLMMGHACYLAFFDETGLSTAQMIFREARWSLIFSAILPLAAYLAFLLYCLLLDLCRAVLILPAKLDKLAEKNEETQTP